MFSYKGIEKAVCTHEVKLIVNWYIMMQLTWASLPIPSISNNLTMSVWKGEVMWSWNFKEKTEKWFNEIDF